MKKIVSIIFFISLSMYFYGKDEKDTIVSIIYRDPTSTSFIDVEPQFLDEVDETNKFISIKNHFEVSKLLMKLNDLQDTILPKNENLEYIKKNSKGEIVLKSSHPFMDTEGKIIIKYPQTNKCFYYSGYILWDKINDRTFIMSKNLWNTIMQLTSDKLSIRNRTKCSKRKCKKKNDN